VQKNNSSLSSCFACELFEQFEYLAQPLLRRGCFRRIALRAIAVVLLIF